MARWKGTTTERGMVTRQDWTRWARKGSTTARGYGSAHQRLREQRLAIYRPGDICAHGGEPLLYWPLAYARRFLDLPHMADRTGYLPGLSCRYHNRSDGGKRRHMVYAWRAARRW